MIKYLLISLLLFQTVYTQSFEKKSAKLSFNIKVPPPDIEPPVLKIIKPLKYGNFPIYSKDVIYSLSGNLSDNSNKTSISINNVSKGFVPNGPFRFDVPLNPGKNLITIVVTDKKGNVTKDSLLIVQDSTSESNPPIVKLTQPKVLMQRGIKVVPKIIATDSILTLKGKISDESEIFGLWVNKERVTQYDDNEFIYSFKSGLPDTIVIEAADKYGNLYRESLIPTTEKLSETSEANINFHAVVIAIQDYKDPKIGTLENPIKDAKRFINTLVTNYTFEEKNVHLLANPTRKEIMSELQRLRKTLGPNDNLLIFYAGHGYWDEEIQQGYWLPVDAMNDNPNNWIANSEIKDYIKGFKTKHTLLIADACFAGNFFRSINDPKKMEQAFQDIYKYPSRTAMTSGAKNAKVPDKSIFVEYLIEKLEVNQEKYWPADLLYQALKSKVKYNSTSNQEPSYGIIKETGDEGGLGEFIFVRK